MTRRIHRWTSLAMVALLLAACTDPAASIGKSLEGWCATRPDCDTTPRP